MNSIYLSSEQFALPVLGLDVAKASVQAELRTQERKVRFGFANNAKGFAELARALVQQGAPRFGRAWKPPDLTARLWRCG